MKSKIQDLVGVTRRRKNRGGINLDLKLWDICDSGIDK